MTYSREIEIERADVDLETGEILSLPVFTGGEATDGHILNIAGAKRVPSMPWFVQHEADPRTQLGTLRNSRVEGDALMFDGQILTDGVGEQAEIRRDLALKIARGHVKRLSGRWDADPKHVKRRSELDEKHPAYKKESFGLYFDKWVPMEGSLVGLGADPAAVMRWAEDEESPESVRGFWRSQIPAEEVGVNEEIEDSEEEIEIELELEPREEPSEEAKQAAALAALRESLHVAMSVGVGDEEICEMLGVDIPTAPEPEPEPEPIDPLTAILERFNSLEERLDALVSPAIDDGREEEVPEAPPASPEVECVISDPLSDLQTLTDIKWRAAEGNPKAQAALIREMWASEVSIADTLREYRDLIAEDTREVLSRTRREIDRLRGKVPDHGRQ